MPFRSLKRTSKRRRRVIHLWEEGAGEGVDTGRPLGRITWGLEMGRTVANRHGWVGSRQSRAAQGQSVQLKIVQ